MLTINEIKKQYSDNLHKFDRGLLREYLQYQILSIIFGHKLSNKLCFVGGTCLRIVYGTKRFSEDLDFDNKNLSSGEFEEIASHVEKELKKMGYGVEIKMVRKGAFHCYVKFPDILFEQKLSKMREEKSLIQLDTFDQGVEYKPDLFVLNKFDVLKQILVAPKEIILAQKLWTITQRKRFKGRDFYDAIFLLKNTKPDMGFLKVKFGSDNEIEIKKIILDKLKEADWDEIARDVEKFLINKEDVEKIKLFPMVLGQSEWGKLLNAKFIVDYYNFL